VADQHFATATAKIHEIPSAQVWFAGARPDNGLSAP
jgi:hypothetical protein